MNHTDLSDLIRNAAAHIRERAEECSTFRGPWRYDLSNHWPTVGSLRTADDDPHGLIADFWPSANCGPYVATMHPTVGLLLVDMLDHVADDVHDNRAEEREFPKVDDTTYRMVVDEYGNQRHDWNAAVAVAREVLGVAAVTA